MFILDKNIEGKNAITKGKIEGVEFVCIITILSRSLIVQFIIIY